MVYTATSTYQYITGIELEAFAITVYLTVDVLFTEVAVMEQVSEAERWVNEHCKQTFGIGVLAPDGVRTATLNLARYYMHVQMFENGHIDEMPTTLNEVIEICKVALKNNVLAIDYSTSATDFDLRNRVG